MWVEKGLTIRRTSVGEINVIEHVPPNPKAMVVCIHGLCSDARIFDYLGLRLAEKGLGVVSIDVLGHGKSSGERGNPNFDQSLQAIHEIVMECRKVAKTFVLAHSMGCTFALWYAHKFRDGAEGLVLMAPYVRVRTLKKRSHMEPDMSLFLKILFRRLLTPDVKVNVTKALPAFVKYGGYEMQQILQDKDLNIAYSYRYIIDVLARRNDNVPLLSSVTLPILLIHGKNDNNIFPSVSEEFIKIVKAEDKTLSTPDSDHWFYDAIFYNQDSKKYAEDDRQKIIGTIESWILSHSEKQDK